MTMTVRAATQRLISGTAMVVLSSSAAMSAAALLCGCDGDAVEEVEETIEEPYLPAGDLEEEPPTLPKPELEPQ